MFSHGSFQNMWQYKRIISHPERLTAEEMAANQGANTNRVPPNGAFGQVKNGNPR